MSYENVSITVTEFTIGGFDTTENPTTVGVVILFIYVLAIAANTANIVIIGSDRKLLKPMYLLICNLAAVDILYTSGASSVMIQVLIFNNKIIAYAPCYFQMFVFHWGAIMEMFALFIMAFDRLLAIGFPLRYGLYVTNARVFVTNFLLWLAAAAVVLGFLGTVLVLPHCNTRLRYAYCDYAAVMRTTCVDPTYYFNVVSTVLSFLIFSTFAFIILSYMLIIYLAKLTSKEQKKQISRTCLTHFIVVTCFYGPIFVRIVLTRTGLQLNLHQWHGLMIGSTLSPGLVNPFVYCLGTKEIQSRVFKTFKKRDVN